MADQAATATQTTSEATINAVDDAPEGGSKPTTSQVPAKIGIYGPPLPGAEGEEDFYLQDVTPDEDDLHPLFRSTVPDDLNKYPIFEALQAIQDDDMTPEDRAEELKARGNAAFNRYVDVVVYLEKAHLTFWPNQKRSQVLQSFSRVLHSSHQNRNQIGIS